MTAKPNFTTVRVMLSLSKVLNGQTRLSPAEYQMIYDTFNKLQESSDQSINTIASNVFQAPLVVDWDNDVIAGDEETLKAILSNYN